MRASILTEEQSQQLGGLMDHVGSFWNTWAVRNYGKNERTKRDNYLQLLPDQWKELGRYYSKFIKQNYFGRFRFRSISDSPKDVESC